MSTTELLADIQKAKDLLKDYGYVVVPRDRVQTLHTSAMINDSGFYDSRYAEDVVEHTLYNMATKMAHELRRSEAVTLTHTKVVEPCLANVYGMTLRIILPNTDD